jgi:hypothetical protein
MVFEICAGSVEKIEHSIERAGRWRGVFSLAAVVYQTAAAD